MLLLTRAEDAAQCYSNHPASMKLGGNHHPNISKYYLPIKWAFHL